MSKRRYAGRSAFRLVELQMRIGFDARWYNDSGVGTYVAGLLAALAECGRDCELVVYENPENPVPGLEGFSVARIPVQSRKYSIGEQWELARRCSRDKLDLLHCPFFVAPYAAPCPVVITIHDLIPFLFRIYSYPKQLLIKMAYRAATVRAAHIIAVSETTSRDIQRVLNVPPENISVVYNAVSPSQFHSHATQSELRYLQRKFGILSRYVVISTPRNWRTKNLATAFKALAVMQTRVEQGFQIVAYGPGDGLNTIAEANILNGSLLRTGFISAEELGMLFRHAHAFLLTSLYEGFGLPLLEAMSCGCPVVTAKGGSLGEIAGDGAQVLDVFDVEGMGAALALLLESEKVRNHWRECALRRAAQFSWTRAAEQTLGVYRQICHASSASKAESCLQA
jgi:glycosyltransferase involved in cell wall biosynthesis